MQIALQITQVVNWKKILLFLVVSSSILLYEKSWGQCISSAPPVVNPTITRCGTGVGTFTVTGAGLVNGNEVYLLATPSPTVGTNYTYNFNVAGTPNNDFLISTTGGISQYQNDGGVITINNYNYSGPNLPNVPASGRILLLSNSSGSFSQPAFNLGPSTLSTGESIKGYAYTGNSVNKMSIYDFNGGPTVAVRFRVRLRNTSPTLGIWSFAIGNGSAFSNFTMPLPASPDFFTRIRWDLSANLGAVNSTYTSGSVTNFTTTAEHFSQNNTITVELYCNNKNEPIIFTRAGIQYVIPAGTMRMWVNNNPVVFSGNIYAMPKNNNFTPAGKIINSLMFFTNSTNNAEIEIDDIQFQPNIESETILASATVAGGSANLTTPVLTPVSINNYKIAQFSTAGTPSSACCVATAQTPVTIKVDNVPDAPTSVPATLNTCGATLPATFTFSLNFGTIPGTAFAIYSNSSLTTIINDAITYTPTVATSTINTAPTTYYITAVSAPVGLGNIIDNATEDAQIYPGCRSSAVAMTIQNTTPVLPSITPSSTFVCGTNSTDLINFSTSTAALVYTWNFDVYGSSSVLNPPGPLTTAGPFNVYWTSTGPKTVQLSIIDLNGCSATTTQVINVYAPPTPPNIQITPSLPFYCTDVSVQVTHDALPWIQNWSFGSPGDANPITSSTQTTTVSWSNAGGKVITLNYTDPNGCSVTVTQTLTVNQLPTLSGITPGGLQVCEGSTATLNINASNILLGASYIWTCDGCAQAPIPTTAAPPISLSWSSALPNAAKTVTLQV
ncbi:MAG: hypothetical protein NZ576_09555, partial [Bacteroidia bacterium]|nr:hypothetical protein [Bacteroidia bacterium]